jgi:hypothetical protein
MGMVYCHDIPNASVVINDYDLRIHVNPNPMDAMMAQIQRILFLDLG